MNCRPTGMLYVFVAAVLLAQPVPVMAADDDGDDGSDAEEYAEPDAWERPPAEKEKAPAPKAEAPVEAKAGDGRKIQIGLDLSWGFAVAKPKAFTHDAWNLGVGLRVGNTFEPGVYGGLYYSYFLGESDTHSQLMAAEAGYDWWVGPVIVRPSLDLGLAVVGGADVSGAQANRTKYGFYFGPGLIAIVPLGLAYVGGEFRHAVITNELQSGTVVSVTGGVRL